MIAIYLFAAIVGLPLVAYAVFAGDADGDLGGGDMGGGDLGHGGIELEDGGALAYLSLGTLSFFLGFFGLTGLTTNLGGAGTLLGLVLAIVVGLIAALAQRTVLGFVKGSSASSHLLDADYSGKAGKVVVPIEPGHRGRISVRAGGQEQYLTATLADGESSLNVGSSVVIVNVEGGVALVTQLDPELA